jgi:hypothetical protein
MGRLRFALLLATGLGTTGCLMAGNYHSARTLEKGVSSAGMTFSITRYTDVDRDASTGETTTDVITLPTLIPEFTYHIGITDDLEAGGRLAPSSLGMEFDVKYRLFQGDAFHLAVAPAIGYQTGIIYSATHAKLPLLGTFDLAENFSVTGAVFGGTARFDDVDESFDTFRGNLGSTGAFLGVELRGETFYLRPGFEWTEYVADFDNDPNFDGFRTFSVIAHFAVVFGREKKQLNRMERKLDRIIDNTEGRPPPPGVPPPTDDSPYPPPMK